MMNITPLNKSAVNFSVAELMQLPLSGSERSLLVFADYFRRTGKNVVIIPGRLDRELHDLENDNIAYRNNVEYYARTNLRQIFDANEKTATVILHDAYPGRRYIVDSLIKQGLAVKNVIIFTNLLSRHYTKTILKWLETSNFGIFAKSFWMAEKLQKDFKGFRIGVIHNPVNSYMDSKLPAASQGIVTDENKLVYLSALQKGLNAACQVLHELVRFHPSVYLTVFSPAYSSLEVGKRFPECKLVQDHLVIKGHAGLTELHRELASSFAVLFPGGYRETFGNSHVEANCLGIPVLAEATGSLPEVLEHSSEQLVLAGSNAQAYVDKLLFWWKYGRPHVSCSNYFHVEQTVQQLLQFFIER